MTAMSTSVSQPVDGYVPAMTSSERADSTRLRRLGLLGSAATLVGAPTAALLLASAAPADATARTLTVDTLADGVATAADCTTPVTDQCSLRDALAAAAAGDTITFAAGLSGTITSTQGQFLVTTSATITGPGPGVLSVAGDGSHRVFYVTSAAGDVEISGLTITGGANDADSGGGTHGGGGLLALNTGNMTVRNCTITGNSSIGKGGAGAMLVNEGTTIVDTSTIDSNTTPRWGSGLYFTGKGRQIRVMNSTISNNTADVSGGGIGMFGGGNALSILNSTIVGNSAGTLGGGAIALYDTNVLTVVLSTITGNSTTATIPGSTGGVGFVYYIGLESLSSGPAISGHSPSDRSPASITGSATFLGSIVSGNTSGDPTHADFGRANTVVPTFLLSSTLWGAGGPFTDAGGNVQSSTPGLAPLANNGGPTKTMALLAGSPAIDAGPTTIPPFPGDQWDQRGPGFARVVNGRVDMGAFEVQAAEPVKPAFTG